MAYSDDLDRMDRKPLINPKPGDKVRIKSIHWYLRWKDSSELVPVHKEFCVDMSIYCGMVMTVDSVGYDFFKMKEDGKKWFWSMEMFEEVYPAMSSITAKEFVPLTAAYNGCFYPSDKTIFSLWHDNRDTELQTIKRHKFIKLQNL